jgi:hypothetical protein
MLFAGQTSSPQRVSRIIEQLQRTSRSEESDTV